MPTTELERNSAVVIVAKKPLVGKVKLGPLGILPKFIKNKKLSEQVLKKLIFLEEFSMERERKLVMNEVKCTEYRSYLYVREFKRFFSLELLVPEPDYTFVPSVELDPVWHHLVLDSRRYVALCNELYGGYVHHTPMDTCPDEMANNAGEVYGYTKGLMREIFGDAPPDAWGIAGKCNTAACIWP